MDDILVTFGGAIKALGNGRFAGPLVTFTDASRPDLAADFFDAATDFALDAPARLPLYYNHGQDAVIGKGRIGTGEVKQTDAGLWYEGQIALRTDYEKAIYRLVEAGKLGLSSGACSHLVEREPVGKSYHLKQWVMAEASLTPEPCEPSHAVSPLKNAPAVKSFKAILQEMADAEAGAAEQPAEPDAPEGETPEAGKSVDADTAALLANMGAPDAFQGNSDALLDALEALPLKTFLEAMGAVASLTDRRLAWYAEQRETKQGRAISAENLAKMRAIHAGMQKHAADLGDIIARHSLNTGHSAGTGDGAVRRPEAAAGNKPKALGSEMGAAFMRFMQAHGGTSTLGAATAGQSVP